MQRTWAVGQNLVIGAEFAASEENNGLLVESRKEYELWDDAGRHYCPATLSDSPALPVLTDWQWANGAPESASDYIDCQWTNMKQPTEMTRLGHYGAYGWYRCRFSYKPGKYVLYLSGFADRASIFLNGELVAVTGYPPENRIMHPALTVELHLTHKDNVLAILVDNLGRIRHDCQLSNSMDNEAKGLFGKVVLDWALELTDWRFRGGLSFENEDSVFHPQTQRMGAAFCRTFFDLSPAHLEASDPIILCTEGLSKGVIWLNGHNLGRFWEIGPIHRSYVPIPWLKLHNELVIFDEMGNSIDAVRLAYDR